MDRSLAISKNPGDISVSEGHGQNNVLDVCELHVHRRLCIKNRYDSVLEILPGNIVSEHNSPCHP